MPHRFHAPRARPFVWRTWRRTSFPQGRVNPPDRAWDGPAVWDMGVSVFGHPRYCRLAEHTTHLPRLRADRLLWFQFFEVEPERTAGPKHAGSFGEGEGAGVNGGQGFWVGLGCEVWDYGKGRPERVKSDSSSGFCPQVIPLGGSLDSLCAKRRVRCVYCLSATKNRCGDLLSAFEPADICMACAIVKNLCIAYWSSLKIKNSILFIGNNQNLSISRTLSCKANNSFLINF